MIAVAQPWTIVRREDDHRVLLEVMLPQCVQDLADRPVEFHNDVAEQASFALAAKLVGHVERNMDHRVRHIKKERLVLVAINEVDGLLRIDSRQLLLVLGRHIRVDNFGAFDQWQIRIVLSGRRVTGPHVVRVGQADVLVKAVVCRQELWMVTQVPFPKTRCRIALLLDDVRDSSSRRC